MSTLDLPETHYTRSGELCVAYQVMGAGPIDLIFVPGMITHVEFMHELPGYTNFLRRFAGLARVVTFDRLVRACRIAISTCRRSSSGSTTSEPF